MTVLLVIQNADLSSQDQKPPTSPRLTLTCICITILACQMLHCTSGQPLCHKEGLAHLICVQCTELDGDSGAQSAYTVQSDALV